MPKRPASSIPAFVLLALAAGCMEPSFESGKLAYQSGKDYEGAYQILLPHAREGHPEAQNYVGTMLKEGKGVEADLAAARGWFEKAADKGFPKAFYNLGVLHAQGAGVPQDFVQAFKWFTLAAEHGITEAADGLAWCRQELPEERIAEADELVREWYAAHPR